MTIGLRQRESTATHLRVAGRDYGWPTHPGFFAVDLWVPHGQDMPIAWLERFATIPAFDERRAAQGLQDNDQTGGRR